MIDLLKASIGPDRLVRSFWEGSEDSVSWVSRTGASPGLVVFHLRFRTSTTALQQIRIVFPVG